MEYANEQVTALAFHIHFMQSLMTLVLASSLCSLARRFTLAFINLKRPMRCFSVSLYRNSTLLFSLCKKCTLITTHFHVPEVFLVTLLITVKNSCSIIGFMVHLELQVDDVAYLISKINVTLNTFISVTT